MASSKRTPIDRNLVDRMSGAIRGAIAGARDAWFGPGEPLNVVAPPSVVGRLTDYPVAWNLSVQPRGEQGETGISFADLRALADPTLGGFDLLRLAIETRKDQMESQRWFIRGRDERPIAPVRDVRRRLHQIAQTDAVVREDRGEVLVTAPRLRARIADPDRGA